MSKPKKRKVEERVKELAAEMADTAKAMLTMSEAFNDRLRALEKQKHAETGGEKKYNYTVSESVAGFYYYVRPTDQPDTTIAVFFTKETADQYADFLNSKE